MGFLYGFDLCLFFGVSFRGYIERRENRISFCFVYGFVR